MHEQSKIAIYEWDAWTDFLLPTLFPGSTRVSAKLDDWADHVISRLPSETKVFIFHLSLTFTAAFPHHRHSLCQQLSGRGVTIINADATNISKAFIQSTCEQLDLKSTVAVREGRQDEELIVKSNLNFGGEAEARLPILDRRRLGLHAPGQDVNTSSYKVIKRSEVPPNVWDRSDLVVERYIQNQANIFYRVYWLLNRMVISRVSDPALLKKMPEGISRMNWYFDTSDDVPSQTSSIPDDVKEVLRSLLLFVRKAKLDFGAIDVVVDDNSGSYIIDVNTTPYWGGTGQAEMISYLRSAL